MALTRHLTVVVNAYTELNVDADAFDMEEQINVGAIVFRVR